ncbi:hypothetical protein HMPREF3039_01703 [Akkermansia sp. KLE1798]|nr:hypothetical protein HMPREF3039_01703 [Akkermansia sp. KLE1798]
MNFENRPGLPGRFFLFAPMQPDNKCPPPIPCRAHIDFRGKN